MLGSKGQAMTAMAAVHDFPVSDVTMASCEDQY